MRVWIIRAVLVIMIFGIVSSEGLARRTHFTSEQKAQLQAIQTVWVKVLALTERGKVAGQPIQDIVQERLATIGYQIATSREEPSDVMFMVKCEERKKWSGTNPFRWRCGSCGCSRSFMDRSCLSLYVPTEWA